eukprot:TRINITY_DN13998_c0_g1_i1.p1 TRINITY_DN13998_c0_g1~~TRINITY_DN13998_c0_g1_i1.p1  ORF type:complete len:245 (-),score=-30.30 TRINITY_DN13998_c0_g1_i1:21-755(-)
MHPSNTKSKPLHLIIHTHNSNKKKCQNSWKFDNTNHSNEGGPNKPITLTLVNKTQLISKYNHCYHYYMQTYRRWTYRRWRKKTRIQEKIWRKQLCVYNLGMHTYIQIMLTFQKYYNYFRQFKRTYALSNAQNLISDYNHQHVIMMRTQTILFIQKSEKTLTFIRCHNSYASNYPMIIILHKVCQKQEISRVFHFRKLYTQHGILTSYQSTSQFQNYIQYPTYAIFWQFFRRRNFPIRQKLPRPQ